jgi:hypothetical protein
MTQQCGHFFLDVDDDVGLAQLFVEARILTLQLLHLFRHGIALGLGAALLRSQGLPHPLGLFSPPIDQQRGVQTFAAEKCADGAAGDSRRLRLAQDAPFVFRGVATPLGFGHNFGVRARDRQGAAGTGAPLRCGSLRSPPLRSAPAPAPETTPREFLFILDSSLLALLINYDYWKCLRDIGTEGSVESQS